MQQPISGPVVGPYCHFFISSCSGTSTLILDGGTNIAVCHAKPKDGSSSDSTKTAAREAETLAAVQSVITSTMCELQHNMMPQRSSTSGIVPSEVSFSLSCSQVVDSKEAQQLQLQ